MEDAEDYEREPCAELYFKVSAYLSWVKRIPENKQILAEKFFRIAKEDISWYYEQAPIESYWDEETRTGDWERVTRSWDRIRASYNEYKGITTTAYGI